MSVPTTPAGAQEWTRKQPEPVVVVIKPRRAAGADECPAWFGAARPVVVDDDPTWQDGDADSSASA